MNMTQIDKTSLTKDKINLNYISRYKSYFTNRFYRIELDLKFILTHVFELFI